MSVSLMILYCAILLQIKQLFTDLSDLSEEIKGVLMKHLSMFNVTSSSDVAKIEERVK